MTRKSFYISAIIIIHSFGNPAHSQGTWENVASPTSRFLTSVHFVDSLYGWAVGDSGTIINTTNGGDEWKIQNSNTTNRMADVFFINRNIGWAVSWNVYNFPFGTVLLKTTDGGQNWVGEPYRDDNIFMRCILFLDSLNGWMGGTPHALVRTTDGGTIWNQADIDSTVLAFFPVHNIKFYNDLFGYACGGAFEIAGVIWKTTNGGDQWFAIEPAFAAPDPIQQIHIFDEFNAMGVGGDFEFSGVGIIRTTDGGNFWEYESIGLLGVAFDLEFRNEYEAWITRGYPGSFIVSIDSGTTWKEATVPSDASILEIFFVDSLHGFAVGENGTILKYKPPVLNGNSAFVNGGFETGNFTGWITNDMVTPFFQMQVGGAGITPGFNMFISNPTQGSFAALHGFEGDGPDTIRIAQDIALPPNSATLEFDYRAGWDLSGGGGTMNRIFMINIEPTGGGPHLQSDIILTALPQTINFDTGDLHGSVDISGLTDSTVRVSFDWYIPENFTGPGFFQLDDVYIEVIIPVELTSFTASAKDGSVTLYWTTATETNNHGFEIQRTHLSPRSIKGGKEGGWEKIGYMAGYGTTTEARAYSYTDSKVAAGTYTYRLKQIDFNGSVDYSDEISVEIIKPLEYVLEQNYPNPFNPSTKIRFQISDIGFVSLKVYDIIGKEIATLVNEVISPGGYEYEFDATNFTSGMYFYKMRAGSFIETKKMILLK